LSKYCRDKGNNYQRAIAKVIGEVFDLDWKEHAASTPQSGGMKWKGDIQKSTLLAELLPFHIECKDQKTVRVKEWMKQAEEDCPAGEIPTVVFHIHNSSKEYILLPFEDFLRFVKNRIQ
jgi:hypothetical protein